MGKKVKKVVKAKTVEQLSVIGCRLAMRGKSFVTNPRTLEIEWEEEEFEFPLDTSAVEKIIAEKAHLLKPIRTNLSQKN